MNIDTRLKKLELSIVPKGAAFCGCYEKYWRSELDAAYNENPDVQIKMYSKPDFTKERCGMCGKPFALKDIEMDKNVEELYGEMPSFISLAKNGGQTISREPGFCRCEAGSPSFVILTDQQTDPPPPKLCDECGKFAGPTAEATFTIATRNGDLTDEH